MTGHLKTIEQQYQILDEIARVRKSLAIYAGSPVLAEHREHVFADGKMAKRQLNYIPALIKVMAEAIDNAVDEHKRNPKRLDTLRVDINVNTGEVRIEDNGGIPVQIHKEVGTYVPEMIFGTLGTSSNYGTEDQALIGVNGLGVKLLNICSSDFIIETADGSLSFKQEFTNGMRNRSEPVIKPSKHHYTRLTFTPDYDFFQLKGLDADHVAKIFTRAVEVAGQNPGLKLYLNGERVSIKSWEQFVNLYLEDGTDVVLDEATDWKVGFAQATDGFEQVSFVNGVGTYEGGTHVDYVTNQVVDQLRDFFKKKHKVEVKPSDIRNHLRVFISANIVRPLFNSQTKVLLISEPKNYKTSYTVPDKVIQKLTKSAVIQDVLDWVEAKAAAQAAKELRDANKDAAKANIRKLTKLTDANLAGKKPEDCVLFLVEGDSAALAGRSVRGSVQGGTGADKLGFFALRGKPVNVNSVKRFKDLLQDGKGKPTEFANMVAALGLTFGEEVKSAKDLRYGKIAFMADADHDGGHICGLLINTLHKYWPELFRLGLVYRFQTPIIRVTLLKQKNKVLEFWTQREYEEWLKANTSEPHKMKYYKGLATFKSEDFKPYLEDLDKHLIQLSVEDATDSSAIELVFGKAEGAADRRKEWLEIEERA